VMEATSTTAFNGDLVSTDYDIITALQNANNDFNDYNTDLDYLASPSIPDGKVTYKDALYLFAFQKYSSPESSSYYLNFGANQIPFDTYNSMIPDLVSTDYDIITALQNANNDFNDYNTDLDYIAPDPNPDGEITYSDALYLFAFQKYSSPESSSYYLNFGANQIPFKLPQ